MSNDPLSKDVLDMLLVRSWVTNKVAEAHAIGLPMGHVAYEMLVQSFMLITPGLTIDQARTVTGGFIDDYLSKLRAQVEAATRASAAKDEKVVPFRPAGDHEQTGKSDADGHDKALQ